MWFASQTGEERLGLLVSDEGIRSISTISKEAGLFFDLIPVHPHGQVLGIVQPTEVSGENDQPIKVVELEGPRSMLKIETLANSFL